MAWICWNNVSQWLRFPSRYEIKVYISLHGLILFWNIRVGRNSMIFCNSCEYWWRCSNGLLSVLCNETFVAELLLRKSLSGSSVLCLSYHTNLIFRRVSQKSISSLNLLKFLPFRKSGISKDWGRKEKIAWDTQPSNGKLRNLLGSDKELELGLGCNIDQSQAEFSFLLSRWTNRGGPSPASF